VLKQQGCSDMMSDYFQQKINLVTK